MNSIFRMSVIPRDRGTVATPFRTEKARLPFSTEATREIREAATLIRMVISRLAML